MQPGARHLGAFLARFLILYYPARAPAPKPVDKPGRRKTTRPARVSSRSGVAEAAATINTCTARYRVVIKRN